MTTPNLALPYIAAAQAQKHVTHNEALHVLDRLVQLAVLDKDLATPPGSPTEGQRWIVAASPTGAWAGHATQIAAWEDGAWAFSAPVAGWIAFVVDEATLYFWNGAAWASMQGVITALQNLSMLGVGTTADATNPFSAKLNKALWTAKYAAEGGDGDLRYTLNKETTSDTASLLFQKGYSGRAEFGLIGDDNLTFKVSADGTAWTNALTVDKTTGRLALAGDPTGALHAATKQYVDAASGGPTAGFLAYLSADVLNVTGDGTLYSVICDTEIVDVGGNYNNATGVFTAPAAGFYQFQITAGVVALDSAVHTFVELQLQTTGRTYEIAFLPATLEVVSVNEAIFGGSATAYMGAGDTAYPTVKVGGSSKVVDLDGNSSPLVTFFSGKRLP